MIDRTRLAELTTREQAAFAQAHPRSHAAYARANHLFGRVPMTWMNKKAGGFPLYLDRARGNRVWDIDGNEYVDFALGDTGAMAGHSPEPVVAAVRRRIEQLGGLTTMLPTEDAEWVAEELSRRFGMDLWSFSLTATDANRWAIRLVRAITGRPKILFNSYCYHGSVDESLIVTGHYGEGVHHGEGMSRPGNVGSPVDVTVTSRVAEFNDVAGLEAQLAKGDVAAVLGAAEIADEHAGRFFKDNRVGQPGQAGCPGIDHQRFVVTALDFPFLDRVRRHPLHAQLHARHVIRRIDDKKQREGDQIHPDQNRECIKKATNDVSKH